MPSPIARRPAGLLDLLLTQQQGQNPSNLMDSVQPTIDLTKFYIVDRMKISAVSVSATVVGSTATHTVPAGEAWLVQWFGIGGVFATVNQRIGVYATIGNLQSSNLLYASNFGGTFTPVGATDIFANGQQIEAPFVLPPGAQVKFAVSTINLDAQPSISVGTRILYVRLEV